MSEGTESWACAVHSEVAAGFRCDGCDSLLCEQCIDERKHLILCTLCGERVFPLAGAVSGPPGGVPAWDSRAAVDTEGDVTGLLVQMTNHVVVPAAIIAMVTALLFFLVDVRSVFLPYGAALKWLGFWFMVGTVMIARYGKVSGAENRQGLYTVMLAGAMTLVLFLHPWEKGPERPVSLLVNVVLVFAVWRYATRLTASLSREREEGPPGKKKPEFFGVKRLEFEAWEREQDDARVQARRGLQAKAKAKTGADAHGNPSAAVAKLALGALVVFAMAEPILLDGPPEAGERALAATAVFLLAAALVLAAGSAVGTLRHARRLKGRASEVLVPKRVALAGFLMIVLLAVVLAVPGITWRGSGELEPEAGHAQDVDAPESESGDAEAPDAPPEGSGKESPESSPEKSPAKTATAMIDFLAKLGRWLWIPFVLAAILGGLYVLSRLAPFLGSLRPTGWRALLARLAAALHRRRTKRRQRPGRRPPADLDLDGLRTLGPREAAVTGYARLLAVFDDLGYPRPERQTPYEFVEQLPLDLRHLTKPLTALTAIYVRAAYGSEELEERDRQQVMSVLAQIKGRLPSPAL